MLTITQDMKNKLADKLKAEYDNLPITSIFGDVNDKSEYLIAIEYLRTGNLPKKFNEKNAGDLLLGVIYDLKTMLYDYGVLNR